MSTGSSSATFVVENLTRQRVVASCIRTATASADRRRGLLDAKSLDADSGLWIRPCEAVHTFGMKIPLDVVFLDAQLRVRKIVPRLKPNRIAFCLAASSVIEIKAGVADAVGLACGDQLKLWKASDYTVPGEPGR